MSWCDAATLQGGLRGSERLRSHWRLLVSYVLANLGPDFMLQGGDDPKHSSRAGKEFIVHYLVIVLDWFSQTSDLNTNKHLWVEFLRCFRKRKKEKHCAREVSAAGEKVEQHDALISTTRTSVSSCDKLQGISDKVLEYFVYIS